ncbi:MAG TPA: outer membrane protein assembly factor BamE [Burkholderiales bacterium]|nr:outer membrane protein assembly factor BamE [Burkholderiales bacterium]
MKISIALAVLLALTALTGCISNPRNFTPGQSTIVDVRARSGTPTDIRFDRNGEELWEYALGPEGSETYLIRFGSDGKVKEITQLLTDEQLMKVVPGTMTKADVKDLLGRPSDQTFTGSGTIWSWRFKRQGVQPGWLTVRFNADNTVFERIAIIDPTDGRRMGK